MHCQKDTPLSSLLVHDAVATLPTPNGITWSDLVLAVAFCTERGKKRAKFGQDSQPTCHSPPQMYIMAFLARPVPLEGAGVMPPAAGVLPPSAMPTCRPERYSFRVLDANTGHSHDIQFLPRNVIRERTGRVYFRFLRCILIRLWISITYFNFCGFQFREWRIKDLRKTRN